MCICVRKTESVEDGVGVDDSNYLASLAESLETYSQQLTDAGISSTNTSNFVGLDDQRSHDVWLGAGNLEAVVRGVEALASARYDFTDTPCSYDEVQVRFPM